MRENDEVDIGAVFLKTLLKIKNEVGRSISVLKKRIVLVVILCLLGGLAGWGFYLYKTPVYKTEMVLTSKVLSNDYCRYLVEDMNNNIDVFAKKIGTTVNIQKVVSIEYLKFTEKLRESKDSLSFGMPFKVRLLVYDPSVIDSMETFIVKYLENNKYALKIREVGAIFDKSLIQKLQAEQTQIDTLKKIELQNLVSEKKDSKENSPGFVFGSPLDPINAYREKIGLYRQELSLSSGLLIPENIRVIAGFTPQSTPYQPILRFDVTVGLLLGLLIGFLIALWLEK